MPLLKYSLKRLRSALEEVERLKQSVFPYPHSKLALKEIEGVFKRREQTLLSIPADRNSGIFRSECGFALSDLFNIQFLGFILRSTNMRNAFEVYGPLLWLARKVLGDETKLLMSSEWNYSPYTYPPLNVLPNFVLIGLPAPESSNPLLIPLAGHELGHNLWRQRHADNAQMKSRKEQIENEIFSLLEKKIGDYIKVFPSHRVQLTDTRRELENNRYVRTVVTNARTLALRQAEEYFCDFVGLLLFDTAYIHAFAYALMPGTSKRTAHYPNAKTRVLKVIEASTQYGFHVSIDYSTLFDDAPSSADPASQLIQVCADEAAKSVATHLIVEAKDLLRSASVPQLVPDKRKEVCDAFKLLVPASGALSLTNILNAAWDVYLDDGFMGAEAVASHRDEVICELTLKSVEILDMEYLIQNNDT